MTAADGPPPRLVEPLDAVARAEDPDRPDPERLVWALLAVAGELRALRRETKRR